MDEMMGVSVNRDALQSYVGRVLALHSERKTLNEDIATVYEEAKSAGFVTRILRQIVREQQMEEDERLAHYSLLDSYRRGLGMLADLPLGEEPEPPRRERPTPFAAQPLHRRGRPKKQPALEGEAAGTA